MKALFVHQNMPGQYKHLAPALAERPGNEVVFVTKSEEARIPRVAKLVYKLAREPHRDIHNYVRGFEEQVLYGQAVVRTCLSLKEKGFVPDIICAHSGWGEALFLRDVFPTSRILVFCEFFYRSDGADVGFLPGTEPDINARCRTRCRNTHMLLSMEAADWGVTPTEWQWSLHPPEMRQRISVLHDGVDTDLCRPDPAAALTLPTGRTLTRDDEVVTYIARNLEPYRGFPVMMQAIAEIHRRRPKAEVVIVGGDGISYGSAPRDAPNWREKMLREVTIDPLRVHFLGRVPYQQFRQVIGVSQAHVYLTFPFVLSWSMLEAMATGCVVIGSRTSPVEEVIRDGDTGLLVDFMDAAGIADRVDAVLDHPDRMSEMRDRARKDIVARYDLRRVCLPGHVRMVEDLVAGRLPAQGRAT